MKNCRIVYFTLNQKHADEFEKLATNILEKQKNDFSDKNASKKAQARSPLTHDIEILKSPVFHCSNDFCHYLDSYKDQLSQLYIIIDFISLCADEFATKANSLKIQEMILRYPEVNIVFDEHLIHKYNKKNYSFVDFIITSEQLLWKDDIDSQEIKVCDVINKEMHSFDIDDEESFISLCYYKDNLFDASNLRFALKAQKYHSLAVKKKNFARNQRSRAKNMALVVEEERSQSLFNCYSAYANGYRSLPVTTANGLIWANKTVKPQIVLRDYDLQFPDELGDNEIHQIRGWQNKKNDKRVAWESTLCSTNKYWGNLLQSNYYITKGIEGLLVSMGVDKPTYSEDKMKLTVPGIPKPVSGIYNSFHPITRSVYREATYTKKNSRKDYIDTGREKGFHGAPLDIYYIVKSIVERAEEYFNNKRYIHAAVLAQEAMQLLNGFHESLSLKAFHLLAISENAIAMNTIGGSEITLKDDSLFRISKIEYEVERILRRQKEENKKTGVRQEFKYNILNQIFSDCRKFCKEKEHFFAEDCFISAMAHVNEGFTLCDIWQEWSSIKDRIKNGWVINKNVTQK